MPQTITLPPVHTRPLMLAAIVAAVLAFLAAGSAHAQEGGLALDCEGNSLVVDASCQFGEGQDFTVAIHITDVPAGGWLAFQATVLWDEDVVSYRPTGNVADEVVWTGCEIPARFDNRDNEAVQTPSVLLGCVPFFQDPTNAPVFRDTGPVWLMPFVCVGTGTGELSFILGGAIDEPETLLMDPATQRLLEPAVTGTSVTCGGGEIVRPEPEVTPRGPGDDILTTEDPDDFQEPTIFRPTPEPGEPTVPSDVTEPTPAGDEPDTTGGADDGDDDGGVPVWVWILIALVAIAGAGGAGYVIYQRRQQDTSP